MKRLESDLRDQREKRDREQKIRVYLFISYFGKLKRFLSGTTNPSNLINQLIDLQSCLIQQRYSSELQPMAN